MTQQILDLQHQVTLIRQSSSIPVQDQNATVIDMCPIMKEVQSLRNELALMRQEPQGCFPIVVALTPNASLPAFPAAKPISPAASACAGFSGPPMPRSGNQVKIHGPCLRQQCLNHQVQIHQVHLQVPGMEVVIQVRVGLRIVVHQVGVTHQGGLLQMLVGTPNPSIGVGS